MSIGFKEKIPLWDCETCEGSGFDADENDCPDCKGTGYELQEQLPLIEPDYKNPIFTQDEINTMKDYLNEYRNGDSSDTYIIEGVITKYAKDYAERREREKNNEQSQ